MKSYILRFFELFSFVALTLVLTSTTTNAQTGNQNQNQTQNQTQAKAEEEILNPEYSKAFSHLKTKCHAGTKTFDLHVGDDSKEIDSESKEFGFKYLWITQEKETIEGVKPKTNNLILFLKPSKNSVCKATEAYLLENQTVAIFFRQNNRPLNDQLGVIFYDPTQDKVLASSRGVGTGSKIEKTDSGITIRIDDPPTDLVSDEVTVQGKKSLTKETFFSYWKELKIKKNEVKTAVEKNLTWKKSEFKDFFKSQRDFDTAFDWDPKTQEFKRKWVYRIDDPPCIQASKERKVNDGDANWHCLTQK